ncbi:MAG: hypothetical protein ACI4IW_02365 [Oscillospiraceae bacterium]
MDKIILSNKDVETLLLWRDQNKDLVRRNAAPFRGIMLELPETNINIKAYNDAGKITFYLQVNGIRAGKITGQQLPGGLFQQKKNTTNLQKDDIQSIITVYASLMALIVYHEPAPAAARKPRQDRPKAARKSKPRPPKSEITYIFRCSSSGPRILERGHHASPAGIFTVRGHYRHYKDGRAVWIKPYKKGEGNQKNKTYRL